MYTLEEMKEILATQFDEVALLEIFDINSFDLVDRFSDLIENNPEKYENLLETKDDKDAL